MPRALLCLSLRGLRAGRVNASALHLRQGGHGGDGPAAAGGDAGGLVGKGQDRLKRFGRQGGEVLLAELGERRAEEGVARAIGVADGAPHAGDVAGLFAQAVEHAVRTEGDEDQLDALLREGGGARRAVGGPGQQGQLLVRDFQDVHQAQRGFHLGGRR